MLDALPGTTLPIYPGLGQAPNMLACIPGGLAQTVNMRYNRYYYTTTTICYQLLKHTMYDNYSAI